MNYATIKKTDVANGPGIRVSLFVSGCTHGCEGCFNKEAWDFQYGQEYTQATEQEILEALKPDYIRGLSLLGGEPMEPENRKTVLELVKKVKECYPDKDIWCYSGYEYDKDMMTWEQAGDEAVSQLLDLLDVLVDGEFVMAKRNLRLSFRGSENQRLIDMKKTRQEGRVVCLEELMAKGMMGL